MVMYHTVFFLLCLSIEYAKGVDLKLYFDIFNPSPFWHKAEQIIMGMREKRPYIYENFESLNEKRTIWAKSRLKTKRQAE